MPKPEIYKYISKYGSFILRVDANDFCSRSFKTAIYGTFAQACAKTSDIVLIKIMTSAPGVEIIIAFFICYLQSLYEIEMGHYFCPEFVGHVTNQTILIDAGRLM